LRAVLVEVEIGGMPMIRGLNLSFIKDGIGLIFSSRAQVTKR
jgi:hypothetical protein